LVCWASLQAVRGKAPRAWDEKEPDLLTADKYFDYELLGALVAKFRV